MRLNFCSHNKQFYSIRKSPRWSQFYLKSQFRTDDYSITHIILISFIFIIIFLKFCLNVQKIVQIFDWILKKKLICFCNFSGNWLLNFSNECAILFGLTPVELHSN